MMTHSRGFSAIATVCSAACTRTRRMISKQARSVANMRTSGSAANKQQSQAVRSSAFQLSLSWSSTLPNVRSRDKSTSKEAVIKPAMPPSVRPYVSHRSNSRRPYSKYGNAVILVSFLLHTQVPVVLPECRRKEPRHAAAEEWIAHTCA